MRSHFVLNRPLGPNLHFAARQGNGQVADAGVERGAFVADTLTADLTFYAIHNKLIEPYPEQTRRDS